MNFWKWFISLFKKKVIPVSSISEPTAPPTPQKIEKKPKRIFQPPKRRYQKKIYEDGLVAYAKANRPRPMTERERELYAIKPNLQWWVERGEL